MMLPNTCKYILVLFFANFISFAISLEAERLIVHLPNGRIQGRIRKTDIDIPYYAFQEIPYATPPVGDLRFKEPVPPRDWEGIRDATTNTKICYQFGGWPMINSSRESEDCLYLNVYSPDIHRHEGNLIPVYVYIHGGGFFAGDSSYETLGPDFMLNYGIIVVTLNYRLGPFGFLSTGDRVIPGNNGLKDQHMALRWVKENIRLFGGDPEKITVGGESAGGASVGYHVLSEKSRGLFRAAILQSGTSVCSFALQKNERHNAFAYASALEPSFRGHTNTELLELLREIPAEKFKSTPFGLESTNQVSVTSLWAGIIEDPEDPHSFITEAMHESFVKGHFNHVPILIGICSEEWLLTATVPFVIEYIATMYDENIALIVPEDFNVHERDLVSAGKAFRRVYTGDGDFRNHVGAAVRLLSDTTISTGTMRHADLHSHYADVYFYILSHAGKLGDNTIVVEGADRVQHASDLNYFWRTQGNWDLSQFPRDDIITQQRLLTLWSNFVIYGDPTPVQDAFLDNVIWPTMSSNHFYYLNINTTLEVKRDPRQYKQINEVADIYANPPFVTY